MHNDRQSPYSPVRRAYEARRNFVAIIYIIRFDLAKSHLKCRSTALSPPPPLNPPEDGIERPFLCKTRDSCHIINTVWTRSFRSNFDSGAKERPKWPGLLAEVDERNRLNMIVRNDEMVRNYSRHPLA